MALTGNQPPPGWYPDPSGQPGARWWDGHTWTPATAPPPPPPAGATGSTARTERRSPDLANDSDRSSFPFAAVGLALGGAIIALFLISGLLQEIGQLLFPGSTAMGILFGEVGLWCGLGGTCIVASRHFGTRSLVRDFGWRVRPVDLAYGVAAALACVLAASVIGAAFIGTKFAGSNTSIITNQKGNTVGVAIVTVIAAVGAPVFEELFFRGLLRQALASRLGVGAIWVQALFFGLAHYQVGLGLGNVSVMLGTAGIGVVLGYTTSLTGRLGADTIAHGMFNLFVTLTIIGVVR